MHNDHLGSTNITTDQSGQKIEETQYDPWGELKTGGTKSKFLYTGQEKDQETGLNYYNARYYDSHTKHFTQPDDIVQDPYDPQTLNRYSYVKNNPLKYTDPSGHAASDDTGGASGAIPFFNPTADAFDRGNYLNSAWEASGYVPTVGQEKLAGMFILSVIGKGEKVEKALPVVKQIANESGKIGNNSVIKEGAQQTKVIAGKITGYTKHGVEQAIGRDGGLGVSVTAIKDTVQNPKNVISQARGAMKYVGEKAVVVLNKFGKIVTLWSKSSEAIRK